MHSQRQIHLYHNPLVFRVQNSVYFNEYSSENAGLVHYSEPGLVNQLYISYIIDKRTFCAVSVSGAGYGVW